MAKKTTIGQLMFNRSLPEEMRGEIYSVDKKTITDILGRVAREHPDKYADVLRKMVKFGHFASEYGGNSISFGALKQSPEIKVAMKNLRKDVQSIYDSRLLNDKQKEEKVQILVAKRMADLRDKFYEDGIKNNNPYALQAKSGSRGNKNQLQQMALGDGLIADHKGTLISLPVLRGYAEGLTPAEYMVSAHGARTGVVSGKMAVAEAGFYCFVGDTEIRMADLSTKPIKDIEVGDMVMGADMSGNTFPVKVTKKFDNGVKPVVEYTVEPHGVDRFSFKCTPGHEFLCTNGGMFFETEKLAISKILENANYAVLREFNHITRKHPPALGSGLFTVGNTTEQEVYDFEVDHPDHLYVLANGVIASNSKQLTQAAHRSVVTEKECDGTRNLAGNYDDNDDIGAVLAEDVGEYKKGTPITGSLLKEFRENKIDYRIFSPITCDTKEGVCARCVGVRDKGRLPDIGDNVGLPAAQALGERVSQGMLSAKHTGGLGTKATTEEEIMKQERSGFDYVNRLIQAPGTFPNKATVSSEDGTVSAIEKAPQGGSFVTVNGNKFYVSPQHKVKVKEGDSIEAGDVLSTGVPNPSEITQYKGVTEGRKYLAQALKEGFDNSGIPTHRRNLELIARGIVNHVKITDPDGFGGYMPDDIVQFDVLSSLWEPRETSREVRLAEAKNKYLDRGLFDYSFGTRITPRVLKDLKKKGVDKVLVNENPPPFEPVFVPAMQNISKDDDWLTSMYGSGLKKRFMGAATTGGTSELNSTSFVPGLARGTGFGDKLKTTGKY